MARVNLVDIRAPLLTWEVINNPSKTAVGFATVGNGAEGAGVHPKLAGDNIMASAFLTSVTVTP